LPVTIRSGPITETDTACARWRGADWPTLLAVLGFLLKTKTCPPFELYSHPLRAPVILQRLDHFRLNADVPTSSLARNAPLTIVSGCDGEDAFL
jgi:hypothetical protein